MGGDWWRRLGLPWRERGAVEQEVDDELDFHFEMRARDLMAEGIEPDEARRLAERDFGDRAKTRARYVTGRERHLRRVRSRMALDEAAQDLRFAVRSLRRRPGFTATAVLVLALGIGASTTVYTLVDTIFFERPAHVTEPHRLVRVFRAWAPGQGGGSLQNADYLYYRDNASTLTGLAAYSGADDVAYRIGEGAPSQLELVYASDNYFDVLGVVPELGRWFRPDENATPGTHPVAVLSHGFWSQATAGDLDVIGREIVLNGVAFTVVGVAPAGFSGSSPVETSPDAWAPIAMAGALRRAADLAWWERHPEFVERWLDVVGRVADGVTIRAATDNLEALAAALDYQGKPEGEGVLVSPRFLYRPSQEASLTNLAAMLGGAVVIVLLVAVSNVAVLLLSRATTRAREIAIRGAMGAGDHRIVRLLMTESLVLALVGGALGVGLAYALSGLAAGLLPLAFETSFTPNARVLAIAVGLSLLTAIGVGFPPALHGARLDLRGVMQDEARKVGGRSLRSALVVAQISMSLVLVSGALLFARSFWTARSHEIGFDPSDVLVVGTDLRSLGYQERAGREFVRVGLERLAELPGARAVSVSRQVPFSGEWSSEIPLPGAPEDAEGGDVLVIGLNAVGPGYFDLMGIEMERGRALGPQDGPDDAPAIVVNETFAQAYWPGEDPVGRVIELRGGYVVVGVARDATYYELGEDPWPQVYLSALQLYQARVNFFVEAEPGTSLVEAVQSELRAIDPGLAFGSVTTLDAVVEAQLARYEVSAVLVGLFGAIALVLAAAGLYGVISFLVSLRSREIGVRMALGAGRREVAGQVLRSGLKLAVGGVVIGLVGVYLLRGFTEALLFGVEPADPWPLAGACATLLLVAASATFGPARRASRVDPIDAMRAE